MIKLNRPVEMLEDIQMKIEDKIELLEERKQAIEDKAYERESGELTDREQERIDNIDEEIETLRSEYDEIENALQYIREYTEY
jgi:prefoldin subunit 5